MQIFFAQRVPTDPTNHFHDKRHMLGHRRWRPPDATECPGFHALLPASLEQARKRSIRFLVLRFLECAPSHNPIF
jgi:hypothetical protein